MAGYLRRLAQHSGVLAAARPRAEASTEAADIREIHEERVIGGAPPVQAAQGGERAASFYESAAAPAAGLEGPAALGAPPPTLDHSAAGSEGRRSAPSSSARADFSAPPERSRVQSPPSARKRDSPAPPASGALAPAHVANERTFASRAPSVPGAAKAGRAAANTPPERGATVPTVYATDARSPSDRLDAPAPRSPASSSAVSPRSGSATLSPSAPARAVTPPVSPAPRRGEDIVHARPFVAPEATTPDAPRRSAVAEPAPVPRREAPAPRAKDNGVKVHIGKINVEIRAPAPRPAVAPIVAAPAPVPGAHGPAEAPFSLHRHYVRGGS